MSVTERRLKEKEEMHELILGSARKIFLEKGYDNTSMRNIAEAIDYSPGTIYFYFKDKAEIFYKLYEEGFRKLFGVLQASVTINDPFERLKAMGIAYLDFAEENMDYYNLMFLVKETTNAENAWEMGNRAFEILKSVVAACRENGRFKNLDTDQFSLIIFATVHGLCSLPNVNRLKAYKNLDQKELLNQGIHIFFAMMDNM